MKRLIVYAAATALTACAAHPYQHTWVVKEVKGNRFRANKNKRWYDMPPNHIYHPRDTLIMHFHQKDSTYPNVRRSIRLW